MQLQTFVKRHTASKYLVLLILVAGIILIIIAGIKRQTQQLTPADRLDAVLASKEDCLAPCWNGIIPGRSTKDAFLDLVNDPANQIRLLRQNQVTLGTTQYIWEQPTARLTGQVIANVDTITQVTFNFGPRTEISLDMILEELGAPDLFIATLMGSHDLYLIMTLFYEERSLIVEVLADQDPFETDILDCSTNITGSLPVRWVYFLEKQPVHIWTNKLGIPPTAGAPQPWPGLGQVSLTSTRCQN